MGKKSRRKGYTNENKLVNLFKDEGLDAKRIPLSGATDFAKGDILLENKTGEVKVRANGFKQIYNWLAENDFLAIRSDRKPFLVVIQLDEFIKLLKKERG
jgi:hypothetical protein